MSRQRRRLINYAKLRGPFLEQHRVCEIQWDERCTMWATEVDHWIDRSLRPDLTDVPANFRAACGPCHRAKTVHVGEAYERGLKGHSWETPN